MSVLEIRVRTARPATFLASNFQTVSGNFNVMNRLLNYLTGLGSGCESAEAAGLPPSVVLEIQSQKTRASGTLTFVGVVATDTLEINGVVFTAVAAITAPNQFVVGVSDNATAIAAAAAVNASTNGLITGFVTAARTAAGVVTVTSAFYGTSGNQATLLGSTHITANVARLAGGAGDASALTMNF